MKYVTIDFLETCLHVLRMQDFENNLPMFNILCHENDRLEVIGRAGHIRYFFIFSVISSDFFPYL